ncbi:hypothetical protein BFW01_g9948 [Lasiodiplodia theobromae]|uniref:uncharacterized protein n=1 Tax=Lasiodiplodia theobromae TaxID=45133 RepID=UPI0015C2E1E0|nr:uncharacterized protein LTHEOB_5144 [Lasiodiplodia theobromae]KAF4545311.1 hypothetical protein LTHEOB_5144 [Lasiodiplodia theobromae]KAF9639051.1 hypothetical protein BFW01_g9948 [Lasiodiplodia theobromae]
MEDIEDLDEQNLARLEEAARKFRDQRRELSETKTQNEVLNDQLKKANSRIQELEEKLEKSLGEEERKEYFDYLFTTTVLGSPQELTKERDGFEREVQAKNKEIKRLEKKLNDSKAKGFQEGSKKLQLRSKRMREVLDDFSKDAGASGLKRSKTD